MVVLLLGGSRKFWNSVHITMGGHSTLPTSVGGSNGHGNIANMWKKHYESLLNSVKNSCDKAFVLSSFDRVDFHDAMVVTANEIKECVNKLEKVKACGNDGIASEHLIYADPILTVILSLCFTNFFIHGFLPDMFMHAVVPMSMTSLGTLHQRVVIGLSHW